MKSKASPFYKIESLYSTDFCGCNKSLIFFLLKLSNNKKIKIYFLLFVKELKRKENNLKPYAVTFQNL